jgi:hypothetical protein
MTYCLCRFAETGIFCRGAAASHVLWGDMRKDVTGDRDGMGWDGRSTLRARMFHVGNCVMCHREIVEDRVD